VTVTGLNLPEPQILEELNFDAVFSQLVADFQQRHPGFDALLYSDPAIKLLEVAAYREVLLRQRVNDAFKATLLGLAEGTDLDNLADFYDVARAAGETDVALRSRVIERIKGSSTAGGAAWYRYQALTSDDRVRDALVTSPDAGQVQVAILSEEGQQIRLATGSALDDLGVTYGVPRIPGPPAEADDLYRARIRQAALGDGGEGVASQILLALVDLKMQADDVRVITDTVSTISCNIVETDVVANIYLYPETSSAVLDGLEDDLRTALDAEGGLGWNLSRSWLISRLHLAGVQRVELQTPAADIDIDNSSAVALGDIQITLAGYDR